MEKKKKVGVYICHCGGNISDYVDVESISELVGREENVEVSKDVMFACADSNQKEMVNDIREKGLDAIVVASCSPKLHLHTFRNVAQRGGLNPYNYIQVNVREQCSWPHSDDPDMATGKAIGLIRGGINRISLSEALETLEMEAVKASVIIGAGVSGMRAAIELARMGNLVYLLEKSDFTGGRVTEWGNLFPSGQNGKALADKLMEEIRTLPEITLFTGATLNKVTGSVGNFNVEILLQPRILDEDRSVKTISVRAGSILVASGYDPYIPAENELGFKTLENVVTLPEFRKLMNERQNEKELTFNGKKIHTVSFIYCVGSRQANGENKYCSRVCCTSTVHTSLLLHEKYTGIRTYHLFRDLRTYGKQEVLYEKSSKLGDVYLKYDEENMPVVEKVNGETIVRVKDLLTSNKEIEIPSDLVVLVTGLVPRGDSKELAEKLKIPVGSDRFFNEIHPKLRPVETVINGVYIGGSCQGPKNVTESVQSTLSAAAKMNALTVNGTIRLDPIVAVIDKDRCVYCDKCSAVCEYMAISKVTLDNRDVAEVNKITCKGCGMCAPVCPENAINLAQYTDDQILSMIDGFNTMFQATGAGSKGSGQMREVALTMKEFPYIWKQIREVLDQGPKTIPEIAGELKLKKETVTWHLMTMNKYSLVEADGMDDMDEYYYYKMKR